MPHALISLYNKDGIAPVATALKEASYELWASGGTATHLEGLGHQVNDVAKLVGGDAILNHRVVTLSREIHAGLLATNTTEDRAELERLGIPFFDLLIVDIYDTHRVIMSGADAMRVNEMTDIGGPAMIDSALKGNRLIVVDRQDYEFFSGDLQRLEAAELHRYLREKAAAFAAGYRILRFWEMTGGMQHDEGQTGGYLRWYGQRPDLFPSTASFFTYLASKITAVDVMPIDVKREL